MAFNFNVSWGGLPNYVERDKSGNWFYSFLGGFFGKNKKYKSYKCMLEEVLSNPALLKVLTYRADLYSQVKIDSYVNDKLKEKDVMYTIAKKPNFFQSWTDLHWDIEFFRCLGVAYIYKQGDSIYCLNPANVKVDNSVKALFQRLVFSFVAKKDFKNKQFKYQLPNNKEITLDLEKLYLLSDLSGTLNNDYFAPTSRLESLYQVAINNNLAITSKTRNLEFTQKFLVSGQHNPDNTSSLPMDSAEKDSIENAFLGSRQIHATKSKVDLTHLVSDLKKLALDEAYLADLTIIANMYGLDTDTLGISTKKSTYDNKEKGIGSFIDYSLMSGVQQMTDLYEEIYEYEDLRGNFKHLSFSQVFEAERISNNEIYMNSLKTALELGVDADLIKEKATKIISM